jgi:hypothetical protein
MKIFFGRAAVKVACAVSDQQLAGDPLRYLS